MFHNSLLLLGILILTSIVTVIWLTVSTFDTTRSNTDSLVESSDKAYSFLQTRVTRALIVGSKRASVSFDACVDFEDVPRRTPTNNKGEFAYITSYGWIPAERSLYVLALGINFFAPSLGRTNYALNKSFPYSQLRHPQKLFGSVQSGSIRLKCSIVETSAVDVSMHEKVHMMRCGDPNGSNESPTSPIIVQMKHGGPCLRFSTNRPRGIVSNSVSVPVVGKQSFENKRPRLGLCIGGVANYTKRAKEIIATQVTDLGIDHVILGLKTSDVRISRAYEEDLKVVPGLIDIVGPSAPESDVVFSQGKLPFINECLILAKFLEYDFLGTWDLDEHLIMEDRTGSSRLASMLFEWTATNKYCYIELASNSRLRSNTSRVDDTNLTLAQAHSLIPKSACGNYSKAIAVVNHVQYLGIHTPESCTFYPTDRRVSTKTESFIFRSPQLLLLHYVQLWDPHRFERLCSPTI